MDTAPECDCCSRLARWIVLVGMTEEVILDKRPLHHVAGLLGWVEEGIQLSVQKKVFYDVCHALGSIFVP